MSNDDEPQWAEEKPRRWECYCAGPMDFGWTLLPTVEQIAQRIEERGPEGFFAGKLLADFEQAKRIALTNGWEGDFYQEARVFFLPKEDEFSFVYAFVWKQRNNGATLVVSPLHLPWLSDIFSGVGD